MIMDLPFLAVRQKFVPSQRTLIVTNFILNSVAFDGLVAQVHKSFQIEHFHYFLTNSDRVTAAHPISMKYDMACHAGSLGAIL